MNITSIPRTPGREPLAYFKNDAPAVRLAALFVIRLHAILAPCAVIATVIAKAKGWW